MASLRGSVIKKWEDSGRPDWDLEKTIRVTEECDQELRDARPRRNPARAFRKARQYIKQWVRGCRFSWLKK